MKRDGNNTSLWQQGMPEYEAKTKTPNVNKVFDVLIVGGGVTGITTGLLLQKAGRSVMIAEAQNIGFGTTGGTTAHLNSFTETPFNRSLRISGKIMRN
jgi:ribulose 1,5-bisphosphate synthetase/thiazole synthase